VVGLLLVLLFHVRRYGTLPSAARTHAPLERASLLAVEGCLRSLAYPPTMMSCAAAAPLMVYMKKETSLNLTKSEIGTGNILAVAANIVARFCTGCAAHPALNPHTRWPWPSDEHT
jgi:hypothetical protein